MPLVCGKRTWASNLQDLVATSHWTGLLFNTFLEEGRRDQVIALHSWRARESCSRCLEESLRGTKNPGLRWTHSLWLSQPKESLSRQHQRLKHRLHRKPLSWLKWKGKKNLWQPRTFHARFKQPSQKPVQQAHVIQPSDRDLKLKPGCNRTHFQSSSCWQTQREDKNHLSIRRNYWLQWEAKHWERVLTFTSVESRTDEWMFLAIGWQEYFGKWNQVESSAGLCSGK